MVSDAARSGERGFREAAVSHVVGDARIASRARELERALARAQRGEQLAHRGLARRVLEVFHAEPALEPREVLDAKLKQVERF